MKKTGITLAGALADRLVFQATKATLCGDPYLVVQEGIEDQRTDSFDVHKKEMAIATIAGKTTKMLIASAAALTERKPRKAPPDPALTSTFAPSASVQQKVLVQRGRGTAYQYLVWLFKDQVRDGDTEIQAADDVG